MTALKRGRGPAIPRAFKDHRTHSARTYRGHIEAILAKFGPLPACAVTTLREAGLAAVELERLGQDLETARARKRRTDAARARKAAFMLREQLIRLERRLEELAAGMPRQTLRDRWGAQPSTAAPPSSTAAAGASERVS